MAGSPSTLEQEKALVPAIVCGDWLGSVLDSVVCGDNCDVLGQFPRESVDLVVTSPPYDDLRTYGGHSWDFYGVAWQLKRVLKPGGVIVWNVADATKDGSETGTSMRQALHFQSLGLNLHDTMIYRKANKPPLNHPRYEQEWEYVFVLSKGAPKAVNLLQESCILAGQINRGTARNGGGDALVTKHGAGKPYKETKPKGNVWSYAVGTERDSDGTHPAIFPLQLATDHVASWSNPGDLVIDPFSGSGTTCRAAKDLNRRFVGIEINPAYVEIAKRRLAQDVLALSA